MKFKLRFKFQESWEASLPEYDLDMPAAQIEDLDSTARKNLEIAFFNVPKPMIRHPIIDYIYWKQERTTISNVPPDIQLEWYLNNFSEMARQGFVAQQLGQDKQISRGIWYYGLDNQHSFSRYHKSIRANLLAMAWIMANDFPPGYTDDDVIDGFVISFVRAWISGLEDPGTPDLASKIFKARNDFIYIWHGLPYDLMEFTESEHKKIQKLTKKMKNMGLPLYLRDQIAEVPTEIITMCQDGEISAEDLKKYGPTLVLEYIVQMSAIGEDNRNQAKDYQDIVEETTVGRLKREHDSIEHDPRRLIPWQSSMVQALLGAVDTTLPHPAVIRKRARPAQGGQPWMTKEMFQEILESGLAAVSEEIDDDLTTAFGEKASLGSEDVTGMQLD